MLRCAATIQASVQPLDPLKDKALQAQIEFIRVMSSTAALARSKRTAEVDDELSESDD